MNADFYAPLYLSHNQFINTNKMIAIEDCMSKSLYLFLLQKKIK